MRVKRAAGTGAVAGATVGLAAGRRGPGVLKGAAIGALGGTAVGMAKHPNMSNAKTAVRTAKPQPIRPGSRVPKKR